jgi:hypothetical protein
VVLEAVEQAAEMWGADWRPEGNSGRLRIPVVQGIRHGVVDGVLRVEPDPSGSSIAFEIEETTLVVNRSALVVLLFGALGGVSVMLWPLSPKILQLAPIGAVLALVAWLLVISRIRNSDAGDFLALVSALAAHP